jgi:DNA-binding LacI/PurR family transcriptional regulator
MCRAASTDPPLTTIHQPHIEKGRTAAQFLLDQIENGATKKTKVFPVSLVIRGSTARSRPSLKKRSNRSMPGRRKGKRY